MSETILIALITFAAGAVGAICGVIGAAKSARITQTSQMHRAVVQQFMQARVSAFSALLDEWSRFVCSDYDLSNVQRLISAIEKASMLTTPGTTALLMNFRKQLFEYALSSPRTSAQAETLSDAAMDLRVALQSDLLRYYEPDIAKLPESAKLPNVVGRPIAEKTELQRKIRKNK
ncbi:hypothetical protein [Agathobaculum desmolans]|uniref:hypothetical protein n=1 Tax=Agathobaculum desmolans TaxID=39484 RepID=UPI0012B52449|nr:hypothetical protein [Agathobaculum desmolans]